MCQRSLPRRMIGAGAAYVLGAASSSSAQWAVTEVPASGVDHNVFVAISGGVAVGTVFGTAGGGSSRAGMWTGTPPGWIDLHPAGATRSQATGCTGGQQVGYSYYPNAPVVFRAGLWTGSAASWVDLHPAGAMWSIANAVGNGRQGGKVRLASGTTSVDHAAVWLGSAESWTDVHPGGADASEVLGIDGDAAAGSATWGGVAHATAWDLVAGVWTDLHPGIATDSIAYGAGGGAQVGRVNLDGLVHAAAWAGTAASFTDLHPQAAWFSTAEAATGGFQAGWTTHPARHHAALWSGTAASWVDLHQTLPFGYGESEALGVEFSGGVLRVVGDGNYQGQSRAVVWTWIGPPLGACCAGTVCSMVGAAQCTGAFQGVGSACGPLGNPTACCAANFDGVNGLTVRDIFAYLSAWFAGDARADINHAGGLTPDDIFDFLSAWFGGC